MTARADGIRRAREWFEHHGGWAPPDDDTLAEWVADGACRCPDDCVVTPDACCEHGLASWWTIIEAQRTEDARLRHRSSGRAEVFVLLALALALGGAFLWAATKDKPLDSEAAGGTSTTVTEVVVSTIPPPKTYKATGGVNIRQGPATTTAVIGRAELGTDLLVVCRTEGEPVNNGPTPNNQWLQVSFDSRTGYVSAAFVDTRGDINNALALGVCPPA